jgi:hypothetical protein
LKPSFEEAFLHLVDDAVRNPALAASFPAAPQERPVSGAPTRSIARVKNARRMNKQCFIRLPFYIRGRRKFISP